LQTILWAGSWVSRIFYLRFRSSCSQTSSNLMLPFKKPNQWDSSPNLANRDRTPGKSFNNNKSTRLNALKQALIQDPSPEFCMPSKPRTNLRHVYYNPPSRRPPSQPITAWKHGKKPKTRPTRNTPSTGVCSRRFATHKAGVPRHPCPLSLTSCLFSRPLPPSPSLQ